MRVGVDGGVQAGSEAQGVMMVVVGRQAASRAHAPALRAVLTAREIAVR